MNDTNSINIPIDVPTKEAESKIRQMSNSLRLLEYNANEVLSHISNSSANTAYRFNQLATSVASVGVVFNQIKSVVTSLALSYMNVTDTLSKMSQRTGIAAESLGGLKFAAEQSGANFDILSQGLKTFQQQLANAQNGKNTIGIVATNDTEEALMQFADRIKNMTSETQQVKAATEAFGRAGYKLLPMLQEGREGIQKLKDEAKRLGMTLDETAIQEGVKLTDATNRMKQSFAGVSNQIVANLAPSLTSFFDDLSKIAGGITSLVSICPVFVSTLGKVTVAFMAFAGVAKMIPMIFTAITAHPVVAALAAIAITIATLNAVLSPTPAKFDAVTHSMQAQREELDETISADKERIERLKQLQKMSSEGTLNNSEISEAKTLVSELSDRYGDLGISIDSVTGRISGVSGATKKMYDTMIEQRRLALEKEKLEIESNLKSLQIQRDAIGHKDWITNATDYWSGEDKRQEEDLTNRIGNMVSQLERTNAQLKNVENSVKQADKTLKARKSEFQIKRQAEAGKTVREGYEKAWAYNRSNEENELLAIKDEKEKFIEAHKLTNGWGHDLSKFLQSEFDWYNDVANDPEKMNGLKGAAADKFDFMTTLFTFEDMEANVRKKYADKAAEEKRRQEEELKEQEEERFQLSINGKSDEAARLARAQQRWGKFQDRRLRAVDAYENPEDYKYVHSAEGIREGRESYAELQAAKRAYERSQKIQAAQDVVNQLSERILNQQATGKPGKDGKTINELKKELENAKSELDKTVVAVTGQGRQEAKKELEREQKKYDKMQADENVSNEDVKKQWEVVQAVQMRYDKQNTDYTNAVGKIQAAQEERANNQISQAKQTIETATSQGTFSAWEVGSIGNNTARQQLDTMKKMLDELIKINKNTEEGAVVA